MRPLCSRPLQALAAGALYPLSLAPFDLWWVGVVAIAAFYWVAREEVAAHGGTRGWARLALIGWAFGAGAFGVGASWVYVSINVYGGATPLLAGFLVLLFVSGIALLFALQMLVWTGLLRLSGGLGANPAGPAFLFVLLWPLAEWSRSWILTGFPWLYAGYGHLETALGALAPVGGVLAVSVAVAATGAGAVHCLTETGWRRLLAAGCTLAPWILGAGAGLAVFAEPDGRTFRVAAVQPNIDQAIKWRRDQVQNIVDRNEALTAPHWGSDLIVWSEASLTFTPQRGEAYLASLDQRVRAAGSALIVGIPRVGDEGEYYNSAMVLGAGNGAVYLKRHLVPFGEYVPLEAWLRGTIRFFDLPMSRNRPGPGEQAPLAFRAGELSLSICYEIAYGELVRNAAPDPALLVTISNDTWFGRSIGPLQHMQIARMRAKEMGRYLVRATNNGVSAVVDPAGHIVASAPQFEADVVTAEVRTMTGRTPFARFGATPLLVALCAGVALSVLLGRRRRADISG